MLGLIAGYVRRHHIGLLALFVALSGTAYAAALPRNSVGPKQLKRNAVTSAKVRNGTLQRADFAAGTLLTGPAGSTGPAGPQGERGLPGANAQFGPVPSAGAGQGPGALVADGGAITVPLDIELYDTEGLYDPGAPNRLVAPRDGVYLVTGNVFFTNGADQVSLDILADGIVGSVRSEAAVTGSTALNTAQIVALDQGDQVSLLAGQSGGAGGINAQAGQLRMHWLGLKP